jgi:hypothetical protein
MPHHYNLSGPKRKPHSVIIRFNPTKKQMEADKMETEIGLNQMKYRIQYGMRNEGRKVMKKIRSLFGGN